MLAQGDTREFAPVGGLCALEMINGFRGGDLVVTELVDKVVPCVGAAMPLAFHPPLTEVPVEQPEGLGVFQIRVFSVVRVEHLLAEVGDDEAARVRFLGDAGRLNPEGQRLDHIFPDSKGFHALSRIAERIFSARQGGHGFGKPRDSKTESFMSAKLKIHHVF